MSDLIFQVPTPEHLKKLLPQYGIEHFIDQGSIGAVYKGRQLSLDRDIAIKVLFYEFGENPEFRESFITEARAMARLNHPNLLGIFDYGNVDGMPYVVMEYVRGESLHDAAWNQVIDPLQAASIIIGICKGMAYAHDQNIVHGDIKPSNILLTIDAEPKVADFRLTNSSDSEKSGVALGTPGYTAPEVSESPDKAGKLADIYSIGVILHQLITGIDPLGSTGPPTQPSGKLGLDTIWRKATDINPSQRYPSVKALASDLEKWISAQQGQSKKSNAIGAEPYNPTKRTLQVAQRGQRKVQAAIGAAPYNPTKRTLQVAQQGQRKVQAAIAAAPSTPKKITLQAAQHGHRKEPASSGAVSSNPPKITLQAAQQAQRKAPASILTAPSIPTTRSLRTPKYPSDSDRGNGVLLKVLIIVILGALVIFTYQLLQERKQDIKRAISDTNRTGVGENPRHAPNSDQ